MCDEAIGVEQLAEQRRGGVVVDEPGVDGQLSAPDVLEVKPCRSSVDTDVGNTSARPCQTDSLRERCRVPNRFDDRVRSVASGEFGQGVWVSSRDRLTTASAPNCLAAQVGVVQIDSDDVARAEEAGPMIADNPMGPTTTTTTSTIP